MQSETWLGRALSSVRSTVGRLFSEEHKLLSALLHRGFDSEGERGPTVLACGRRSALLLKRLRPGVSIVEEPVSSLSSLESQPLGLDGALAVLPARGELAADPLPLIRALASRLRPGAVLVVRTPARAPQRLRMQLSAAFLHAGLAELCQQTGGRGLFTAGRRVAAY